MTPEYTAALNAYNEAKAKRIAAEQALKNEVARQQQEAAKVEQGSAAPAAYKPQSTAKRAANGSNASSNSTLPTTGDNAALAGETFVIGGAVLVASGVFPADKKRRQE